MNVESENSCLVTKKQKGKYSGYHIINLRIFFSQKQKKDFNPSVTLFT